MADQQPDIVQRLSSRPATTPADQSLLADAADTITALRAELSRLQADLDHAMAEHNKTAESLGKATVTIRTLQNAIERLQAAGEQGVEPLFLLHTGQIDSSGEQDEWETEADSQQRVDEFCAQHPGQTIKLYPHPPAAPALVPMPALARAAAFEASPTPYMPYAAQWFEDGINAAEAHHRINGLTVGDGGVNG